MEVRFFFGKGSLSDSSPLPGKKNEPPMTLLFPLPVGRPGRR